MLAYICTFFVCKLTSITTLYRCIVHVLDEYHFSKFNSYTIHWYIKGRLTLAEYVLPYIYMINILSTFSTDTATPQPQSCKNMTFLDHGQKTKAKSFYNILYGQNASTCQTSCKFDNLCRAFRIIDETCKLSASDLTSRVVTIEQCHKECENDEKCYGFAYDDETQKCTLSNVKVHHEAATCDSCRFYEKKCQSGRL